MNIRLYHKDNEGSRITNITLDSDLVTPTFKEILNIITEHLIENMTSFYEFKVSIKRDKKERAKLNENNAAV